VLPAGSSVRIGCDWGFAHSRAPSFRGAPKPGMPQRAQKPCGGSRSQGRIKRLDFSLSAIGWRRGLGRGGACLLVSPLLGPLPTRSSRGEDGELDAALGKSPSGFALLANAFGVARWWPRAAPPSSRHPAFSPKTAPLVVSKQALTAPGVDFVRHERIWLAWFGAKKESVPRNGRFWS